MKQVFFMSLMMLTVSFAFANEGKVDQKNDQQKQTNKEVYEQPQKVNETCKITLENGTVIECSDCDCAKLAVAVIIATGRQ